MHACICTHEHSQLQAHIQSQVHTRAPPLCCLTTNGLCTRMHILMREKFKALSLIRETTVLNKPASANTWTSLAHIRWQIGVTGMPANTMEGMYYGVDEQFAVCLLLFIVYQKPCKHR